jgi:hypothetical protein
MSLGTSHELHDEWVTVKEYAFARKVNVQTVYSAIRRGHFRLPFERIGRTIRIDVSRGSIQDRKAS